MSSAEPNRRSGGGGSAERAASDDDDERSRGAEADEAGLVSTGSAASGLANTPSRLVAVSGSAARPPSSRSGARLPFGPPPI